MLSGDFIHQLTSQFGGLEFVVVETIGGHISRQLARCSLSRLELLDAAASTLPTAAAATAAAAAPSPSASSASSNEVGVHWLSLHAPVFAPFVANPALAAHPVCEELGQLLVDVNFDGETLEFR